MIRFEEMTYATAIHPGRMGERWQASAARARIPAPLAAESMLRSAWCKVGRCGVWPATIGFASGAEVVWEISASGGGFRSEE
jgi:hypothetical protein